MASAMTTKFPRTVLATSDPETLAAEILRALKYRVGKDPTVATPYDWLTRPSWSCATASSTTGWSSTQEAYDRREKRVYYLSLEFLIGRLMRDALSNHRADRRHARGAEVARRRPRRDRRPRAGRGARQWRPRPAGRLLHGIAWRRSTSRPMATASATCNGMFRQEISRRLAGRTAGDLAGARQSLGIRAPRERLRGRLRRHGRVDHDANGGAERYVWKPAERVLAVAFDTPIVGWRGKRVNTLRLWTAHADRSDPARRLQRRRPYRRAAPRATGPKR